jgi:DNA-binding SARP family transcriptional activator
MVAERPDDASAWRQLGFALAMSGQTEASIKALERSLNLDPKQGKTWVALLENYNAAGRKDDFKRAYDKLRGIDSAWAAVAYKQLLLPYEEGK